MEWEEYTTLVGPRMRQARGDMGGKTGEGQNCVQDNVVEVDLCRVK